MLTDCRKFDLNFTFGVVTLKLQLAHVSPSSTPFSSVAGVSVELGKTKSSASKRAFFDGSFSSMAPFRLSD